MSNGEIPPKEPTPNANPSLPDGSRLGELVVRRTSQILEEIRFLKNQQWRIANYSLVLIAALYAIFHGLYFIKLEAPDIFALSVFIVIIVAVFIVSRSLQNALAESIYSFAVIRPPSGRALYGA